MKTQCPTCQQKYELEAQYANAEVECTSCGESFFAVSTKETKNCPMCGEEILAVAKKCKHCGEWLDASEKQAQAQQEDNKVNLTTYALLGLFLGGIGAHNFYAGEKNKGKNKIGASIISFILLMIGISDPEKLGACLFFASIIGLTVFIFIIYEICNPPKEKYIPQRRVVKINRFIYILLALLLGWLGVHNFYAGQHVYGLVRLIVYFALGFLCVTVGILFESHIPQIVFWFILFIWSVFDICTMPKEKTVYS